MRRFIMFTGVLSLILDFYVFQAIKTITARWRSEQFRKIAHWAYWLFQIGFTLCFVYVVYLRFTLDHNTAFMKLIMNGFLVLFVTKLIVVAVLFAEDIYRGLVLLYRMMHRPAGYENERAIRPGRRKFISQLALGLAAIPFASLVYGMVKGKHQYTVHRHTLFFDDLPEAFDGFKITQLSDFHAGSFEDVAAVQEGIDLAKAQNPDLVVFTGDLVNDLASELEPFLKMLGQLKAPFGQFSILGNHDYGMYAKWPDEASQEQNLATLKKHHAAMDYRLLLDESVMIEKDGQKLALLGVENWGTGFIQLGDLDRALANVEKDAFKILLSHDPSHWQEKVKQHPTHVHLTLSGHTHGMQFGVETPLFKWSPAQYRYENWAGLSEENGRRLYVNRGFGYIGFSGRVGIWPEITVLELRKGKSPGSLVS